MNELHPELLGLQSLNFAAANDSPSRAVMFGSHFSQHLVIDGSEDSRIQTGAEQEFGKYTFGIRMPEDGKIIAIIPRFPAGVGKDSIPYNPETIVIYEKENTGEIDCFSITDFASYHQYFGYKYKFKEAVNQLKPNAYIAKGTVFADSPAVSENTNYGYGINLNIALMSIPSVSEDGIMISRDVLDKMKFRIYERRSIEFGESTFPLNLYGSADEYKVFPDIGSYINENGALMMLRTYDDDLMPVEMSVYDTREPDFMFDKGVYVRGGQGLHDSLGKGKVVDVRVIRNNSINRKLPPAMCKQLDKYADAQLKFHEEIVKVSERIKYERSKKYGDNAVKLSPKLHRLIVESLAILNQKHSNKKMTQTLNLIYRKNPVDEYRVDVTIEYEITPNIGFKLSDRSGAKGVICKIEEPENMPVDANGVRADMVMDDTSTISRMNLGRLYCLYLGGSIRDTTAQIRKMYGSNKTTPEKLQSIDPSQFEQMYNYLLGYYQCISEKQFKFFSEQISQEEKYQHMADIINKGIYIYSPVNNDKDLPSIVKSIEAHYPPTYGPLSYVGNSGKRVTTKKNIRIGQIYVMLLDKIADDWSAVSSGKLQHFGVLSPVTKSEKFSFPYHNSPTRTIGESEGRIFAGYCGREAIAEMMDRSNNSAAQRNAVMNILTADKPTNIDEVVDRQFAPLGASRPLQLVNHIMGCAGIRITYRPEKKKGKK